MSVPYIRPTLRGRLQVREEVKTLEYWRKPTPYELRFGEGAVHFREFDIAKACHKGTRIPKNWLVADDGLRYYR